LAVVAKSGVRLSGCGGILHTFLLASGLQVGKSLVEKDLAKVAGKIMAAIYVPMPEDVVVATEISARVRPVTKAASEGEADEMILDIGPKSAATLAGILK